ncbi:MAG: hypothetical protein AAGH57_15475 [Pseudomonadota bacterium]
MTKSIFGGLALIAVAALAGCSGGRNAQQERIYDGCVLQAGLAASGRIEDAASVSEQQAAVRGVTASVRECDCVADRLYDFVSDDGKTALERFYNGGGLDALTGLSPRDQDAFEGLCG